MSRFLYNLSERARDGKVTRCYELREQRGNRQRVIASTPIVFGEGPRQDEMLAGQEVDVKVLVAALQRLEGES